MTYSIEAIRAHAVANYNKDGWDFLVECWSDEDIAEAAGNARSDKAAIAKVKAALRPLSDMRSEVRAAGDCDWSEPVTVGAGVAAGFEVEAEVMSAEQAAAQLPAAAKAAIEGKAEVEAGKAKGASALAIMIAAFASDEIDNRPWAFDITAGDDVHQHVACVGIAQFGRDDLEWVRNGEGKVSRAAQGAYKAAFQRTMFGLDKPSDAVWTPCTKAVPIARAIRAEGMVATIENGELKLSGGNGPVAEALRDAKSIAAMGKIAKGETGTNRAGHGNAKGGEGGDSEVRVATPSEVLALAARLVEGAAKGQEALAPAALSFARKIAALVAANPDAFAED